MTIKVNTLLSEEEKKGVEEIIENLQYKRLTRRRYRTIVKQLKKIGNLEIDVLLEFLFGDDIE